MRLSVLRMVCLPKKITEFQIVLTLDIASAVTSGTHSRALSPTLQPQKTASPRTKRRPNKDREVELETVFPANQNDSVIIGEDSRSNKGAGKVELLAHSTAKPKHRRSISIESLHVMVRPREWEFALVGHLLADTSIVIIIFVIAIFVSGYFFVPNTVHAGVVIFDDGILKSILRSYQDVASTTLSVLSIYLAFIKLPFQGTDLVRRPVPRIFWLCWGQLILIKFLISLNSIAKSIGLSHGVDLKSVSVLYLSNFNHSRHILFSTVG